MKNSLNCEILLSLGLFAVSAASATVATATLGTSSAALSLRTCCRSGYTGVRRKVLLAVNLTVADPYLDTERTYLGPCH